MEAFVISLISVAAAEIGDKTQILAFILTCRYKQPYSIVLGIFLATLANHTLAALAGEWASGFLHGNTQHQVVGIAIILAGLWVLIPDKIHNDEAIAHERVSVFFTALITFFILEMGDKTQIATAILAAKFQSIFFVILGTTVGMLAANIPVVILGERANHLISLKLVRYISSILFISLGVIEIYKGY